MSTRAATCSSENGGNTNVYIYNCGTRGIHTLPATGAGPAGSSFPLTGWALALMAVAVLAAGMTLKPALARGSGSRRS